MLPLALSGGTLQAWLVVGGVDIKTIGLFTLVDELGWLLFFLVTFLATITRTGAIVENAP